MLSWTSQQVNVGQLRQQFADGIEGLMDLVIDAAAFADYAELVRDRGVISATNFVSDKVALEKNNLCGGNFRLGATPALVEPLGASAANGKLKVAIQSAPHLTKQSQPSQRQRLVRRAARW